MFYLDNGATSWPKPESVYTMLDSSFRQMFSPKRGTSKASRMGGAKLDEARQVLADLCNIQDAKRVFFTSGATHALNLAIQAFPWEAGDGVIMSAVEHHAVSRPIRKMAREKGIEFYIVPYTDELPFDLQAYEALLKSKPNIRMVATTHASNVIGSVLPIAEIGRLAHEYGAVFLVDAAQTAGVLPVDVQAQHIDILALPGHKSLYGPPGVGALYLAESIQLNNFMEGGTGGDSGKNEMAFEVEVGTIPLPLILAFAEGAKWVQEKGIENIHHHEKALLELLLSGLEKMPEITIYGHRRTDEKTPVVSFNVKGFEPEAVGAILFDDYGIALRAGYHCAPMAHEAIGTLKAGAKGGTIRASIGYFTKKEDVEALLNALKEVIAKTPADTVVMS